MWRDAKVRPLTRRRYDVATALAGPLEPLTARLALHLGLTRREAARLRQLGVRYAAGTGGLWLPDAPALERKTAAITPAGIPISPTKTPALTRRGRRKSA